jgi:hypothetical protein
MLVHEKWPWFGGFWPAKKDWEKTPQQKQTHHNKTGPYVSLDFPNK